VLKNLAKHFGKSEEKFLVVRVSRKGHHYYSILASENGFEYVFRNGHDRWSTISPSFAKRVLEHSKKDTGSGFNPKSSKDFLTIATRDYHENSSSWKVSNTFTYTGREEAIRVEREILDDSWANVEGELDGL